MRTRPIMSTPTHITIIQGAYAWHCAESQISKGRQVFDYYTIQSVRIVAPAGHTEIITDPLSEDRMKFQMLLLCWRAERGATSSITEMAMCSAYQSIIGMGEKAIPLILAELESEGEEPDLWFWALQVLTGVNPVRPEDQGDFLGMARAWLTWAKNQEWYAWSLA